MLRAGDVSLSQATVHRVGQARHLSIDRGATWFLHACAYEHASQVGIARNHECLSSSCGHASDSAPGPPAQHLIPIAEHLGLSKHWPAYYPEQYLELFSNSSVPSFEPFSGF